MSHSYSFGEFVLDVERRTLHRGNREIEIGARSFGVLELLVVNAGRVVSRHELLDGVWGDVAVTDDSLARAVSDLRTALDDDASHPRYIRTVHRKGYVLVAPVAPLEDVDSPKAKEDLAGRQRSRLLPTTVGLAVALIVVLVVSVLALQRLTGTSGDDVGQPLPDFAAWRLRALGPTPFIGSAIKPAFAKSQRLLSVVAPDPESEVHSIFLLRPDGGEPLQLTQDLEVRGPAPEFTADDSGVLFTSYRSDPEMGWVPDVWLAPIPAGEPTRLVERASAASTSPDGRSLVYAAVTAEGTSIRVRHPDGRELDVAERGFWPRWSPGGEWIAYTTSDPEGGGGTLHVVHPDGSGHRALTTIPSQMYGLCWMPESNHVIFASEQGGSSALWSVDVDSGAQSAVTRGPGICTSPTISPEGETLVFDFDHRYWYLYLASATGEPLRQLLVEPGMMAAALSPDGRQIAIALGTEAQSPAVALLDIDTLERRTLSGMAASAVAWMPGGRDLLVAAAAPDGVSNWIWRLPVGGGLPEPVLKGQEYWDMPSASPDGSRIAAVRRSEAEAELVVHDLQGSGARVLAVGDSITAPGWSPDGRLLAWSGAWRPDDLASGGIWVCPAEGGSPQRLAADGVWPAWEADGEHLLFIRIVEHEGIWRVPTGGGPADLVYRLDGDMEDLYAHALDIGRSGTPLMVFLYQYSGELYALESPDS